MKINGIFSIGFTDIVGTGIAAAFWFFLATIIEPNEFGEIFYFLGIAGLVSYIALIGTQNTIIVYVAKKIKIQSTLYLLSLIVAGISSIVLIMIFYRVDISLILLAYVINTLALGELLGKKLYTSYSRYFLIQKILTLVLGFGFYYLFDIQGIIFALALSYIAYIVRVYKGFKESKIDFSLLKSRGGFIVNNYVLVLAQGSKRDLDKLIIAPLLGFALLGNYALALQIIGLMLIFSTIVFKYTLAEDANGITNKKLKAIALIISVGIAILGIILSPVIIPEFFPKYVDTVDAIQIMSISVISATISGIYSSKFLGAEKSKFVIISKIISLSILISGMIILGSILGIIGLAISFVLASFAEAIAFFLINLKLNLK